MDFVSLGKALSDLGGFALFLVTVAVAVVGLHRQWWVPGWIWRERSDDVKELNRTVARLTEELRRERQRRRGDSEPR